MEPMATRNRAKTHSVRIRNVSFRCVPGSKREYVLNALKRQDRVGHGMPYYIAAACTTMAFLLGFASGWWL
jgi:hypothetical protein